MATAFYLSLSTVGMLAVCGLFMAFAVVWLSTPRQPRLANQHNRQIAGQTSISFVSRLYEREAILALIGQELETAINGRKRSQLTKADCNTITDTRQFCIHTLQELSR